MSYYWVYEYGTIARSYGLSLLLLIGAVLLYPQRQKRLWLIAVILALMINVHILNAVFAGGIAWLVFAERWRPEIAFIRHKSDALNCCWQQEFCWSPLD
jgi:hypothetical protein